MGDTEKQCAKDKNEITEEAPVFTSYRLRLADAAYRYTAPPRASMG